MTGIFGTVAEWLRWNRSREAGDGATALQKGIFDE
jgi:hypothetical protein